MLTIRNIEKLNDRKIQKFLNCYIIKEVIEDFGYYKFLIEIVKGKTADTTCTILLDRQKEPVLNRYLLCDSKDGNGIYLKSSDMEMHAITYYIDNVLAKCGMI